VLDGRQHNTYDIEFTAPTRLTGFYYLAALRSVEKWRSVGRAGDRGRCRALTSRAPGLDESTWNGEYFVQRIEDVDAYRYQHGLGCLADQLLGQVHAHALGLGYLVPQEHIRAAIKNVFDYNFRTEFHDHSNCQRTYVLNDESGLLMCTWPQADARNSPSLFRQV